MTVPRWLSVAALYALQNSMMLTPCWPSAGPTGGAGLACPAWICNLMIAVSFFLGGISSSLLCGRCCSGGLDLRDLAEGQLDRRLAAEDRDEHLQLLVQRIDLADRGRQGSERAVHDGDRFTDGEVDDLDLGLGRTRGLAAGDACCLLGCRREDLHDLVDRQGRRT